MSDQRLTDRPAGLTLGDLDEDQRYARFDQLQAGMPDVWNAMRLNHVGESVVVLPSVQAAVRRRR